MKIFYEKYKAEIIFLTIGIVFGLVMIFANPPWQGNDENRHFFYSYVISNGQIGPKQGDEKIGGKLPKNLFETATRYQGIPFHEGAKIPKEFVEDSRKELLNPNQQEFYHFPLSKNFPLPYIPAAIGIGIGKIIDSGPVGLNYSARIGILLVYLAICLIALRLMPIQKFMLITAMLAPMAVYQASSVSYDAMHNALSFLIVAFALYLAFNEGNISKRSIIAFFIVAVLHRFSKDGYIFLPLLFLIIPREKFKSKIEHNLIIIGLIVVYFLPNITWQAWINSLDLHSSTIFQKDFVFNPSENISRAISNPFGAIGNLFGNIFSQGRLWITGSIGRFGYSYSALPEGFIIIYGLGLISLGFFDSSQKTLNLKQKWTIGFVGFFSVLAIIVGFYINSPVGATTIYGLQGRYFVPFLPIFPLLLSNDYFLDNKWIKTRPYLVGIFLILALTYVITFINTKFYGIS